LSNTPQSEKTNKERVGIMSKEDRELECPQCFGMNYHNLSDHIHFADVECSFCGTVFVYSKAEYVLKISAVKE